MLTPASELLMTRMLFDDGIDWQQNAIWHYVHMLGCLILMFVDGAGNLWHLPSVLLDYVNVPTFFECFDTIVM